MNYVETEVTLTYIRGGISAKKAAPYLQCSNGRAEFFVKIPKVNDISEDTFAEYEEGDEITFTAKILPGSDSITFIGL